MKKKELGQFYTTNSNYIFEGLLDVFPADSIVIDPYSGNWDILNLLKDSNQVKAYDIDPKIPGTIEQDTLTNPPDYNGLWVASNPPYLALNKTDNKTLFNKYGLDDLYKIALKTMLECEGGAIVIPLNFFSNDRSVIRKEFLSKFRIKRLNIFEEQVFDDTAYTVCSFSFTKSDKVLKEQSIDTYFYPSKEQKTIVLSSDYNFMLGGKFFFEMLDENDLGLKRLRINESPNSNLFLRAIDGGSMENRIALSMKEPFFGKVSDRVFATIVLPENMKLLKSEQKIICAEFNQIIEKEREKYHSLFLTNFRNSSKSYARKRISFDLAYGIISHIIKTKFPEKIKDKASSLF